MEEQEQKREVVDLGYRPRKRNSKKISNFLFYLGIIVLVLILAAFGFIFFSKKTDNKTSSSSQEQASQATSSSKTKTSSVCNGKILYENTKQGYKICLDSSWQTKSLKASDLEVGFDSGAIQATPKIKVAISDKPEDVSLQDTENNSSKFEFGKETVDNVKGTQVTFTRLGSDPFPRGIETYLSKFGRTYTVTLNSTDQNFDSDQKTYEDFLSNFKFIPNTTDPPWADSGNILVFSPWPNDKIASPVELSGEAIAFEAVVNVRIKDSAGQTLTETTVNTSSGQERSPFDQKVTFSNPTSKKGTIEVFTKSAKDGSEQDKVTIPVNF